MHPLSRAFAVAAPRTSSPPIGGLTLTLRVFRTAQGLFEHGVVARPSRIASILPGAAPAVAGLDPLRAVEDSGAVRGPP